MKLIRLMAAGAVGLTTLSGCTMFNDNLSPCPEPITELSFRYDYNMDYKDYFKDHVHCLDLYIFDEEGNFVDSYSELDNTRIKNGGFTVGFPLPPGKYVAYAYGGTACKDASFVKLFESGLSLRPEHLKVDMKGSYYYVENENTDAPGTVFTELTNEEHESLALHNLFYGKTEFEVMEERVPVDPIYMRRNTNDIKVNVGYEDKRSMDKKDFHLTIEDDNNTFDYQNNLTKSGKILYRPWVKDDTTIDHLLQSEFTISRLVEGNNPVIMVKSTDDKENILEIPVIGKIGDKKAEVAPEMPLQEYLDRENSWLVEITLPDDASWADAKIEIKEWDVNDNPVYDFE